MSKKPNKEDVAKMLDELQGIVNEMQEVNEKQQYLIKQIIADKKDVVSTAAEDRKLSSERIVELEKIINGLRSDLAEAKDKAENLGQKLIKINGEAKLLQSLWLQEQGKSWWTKLWEAIWP